MGWTSQRNAEFTCRSSARSETASIVQEPACKRTAERVALWLRRIGTGAVTLTETAKGGGLDGFAHGLQGTIEIGNPGLVGGNAADESIEFCSLAPVTRL